MSCGILLLPGGRAPPAPVADAGSGRSSRGWHVRLPAASTAAASSRRFGVRLLMRPLKALKRPRAGTSSACRCDADPVEKGDEGDDGDEGSDTLTVEISMPP